MNETELKLWQRLHGADRIFGRSNICPLRQRLHGADRIFGRSLIWPLRRTVHTGQANRSENVILMGLVPAKAALSVVFRRARV